MRAQWLTTTKVKEAFKVLLVAKAHRNHKVVMAMAMEKEFQAKVLVLVLVAQGLDNGEIHRSRLTSRWEVQTFSWTQVQAQEATSSSTMITT